jgi:hypothetical protein
VDHPSSAEAMDQSPSTGADSSTAGTMSVDDQQLRGLRSQVRLSEAFSGIKFTNTSWEITHKGTVYCRYTIYNKLMMLLWVRVLILM